MPCFLVTYHAYGSWLPDRPDGYVHWREGLQPTDADLAIAYRRKMKVANRDDVVFSDEVQQLLLDELHAAGHYQTWRLHAAATETTHVHALLSWTDDRGPDQLSEKIHESLTRRLNDSQGKQKWLAKNGHERRVKDLEHFDYLRNVYLPSHGGWKWDEVRGLSK